MSRLACGCVRGVCACECRVCCVCGREMQTRHGNTSMNTSFSAPANPPPRRPKVPSCYVRPTPTSNSMKTPPTPSHATRDPPTEDRPTHAFIHASPSFMPILGSTQTRAALNRHSPPLATIRRRCAHVGTNSWTGCSGCECAAATAAAAEAAAAPPPRPPAQPAPSVMNAC